MVEKVKAILDEENCLLEIVCDNTAEYIATMFVKTLNTMPPGWARPGKYIFSLVDKDLYEVFYEDEDIDLHRKVAMVMRDDNSVQIIDDHEQCAMGISDIISEYKKLCGRLEIPLEK